MNEQIAITDGPSELAALAAERFIAAAASAISARGVFDVALSGGSTPAKMFNLLAAHPLVDRVDWQSVRIFFGDERYVPADDERSNYGMARRTLLAGAPIPPQNIFAVDTSAATVQLAARRYESLIARELGSPPIFDLVLLGMGDDGHTASLFPDSGSLDVTSRMVIDCAPGILPPPVDRITLTLAAINNARRIMFVVGGDSKADAVYDVLRNRADFHKRPSTGVRPTSGELEWLLDNAAARLLNERH